MEKPIANMIRLLTKKYCIKQKEQPDRMRNLVSDKDQTPPFDNALDDNATDYNDNNTTYLDGGDRVTDLHSL